MATVKLKALSEVGRLLGWREKEIQFSGSTLGDLLRSLSTQDGRTLYELLVAEGRMKGRFIVSVNGRAVRSLDTHLDCGDRIVTMEMVRLFQGG